MMIEELDEVGSNYFDFFYIPLDYQTEWARMPMP